MSYANTLLVIFAGLLLSAARGQDASPETTPVAKVIDLLEDLKTEIEAEGTSEATTYDAFACFCRSTTELKSTVITEGRDTIDSYSMEISSKTAEKESKATELEKRKADQEALAKELADTVARHEKATAEYEATAADLSKAISSLKKAIQAMKESKPTSLISIRKTVAKSLQLADVLNLIPEGKQNALSAFLQVDPSDPGYAYQSQGIIDTLLQLEKDFTAEKSDLDEEWGKTVQTFTDTKSSLEGSMEENSNNMDTLDGDISTLKGEIATAREQLVEAEAVLKDDQLYLKDLTERCETRAKDWDQRSQLRKEELTALESALQVIRGTVQEADSEANKRALFVQQGAGAGKPSRRPPVQARAALAVVERHTAASVAPALLQEAARLRGAHAAALSLQVRQEKAARLLRQEAQRIGSAALATLVSKVSEDPFLKVKTLIQQLIERLLKEATSEATKKGFCDEQLGKATQDRDFRLADSKKLDIEIKGLNLKKDELEAEIQLLTDALVKLNGDLTEATTQRGQEHDDNVAIIKKAKEGLAAVSQALDILKVFYAKASRANVLLQASPVDEDTEGAGFAGAYQGKQESAKGILGMLEVIRSDFDRTVRFTEAAEKKAHADFVEFDRVSRADISGKEKKKVLDEEDLEATNNAITQKMSDLETAQGLLDEALKAVEALKPTCIDTGMSYEERLQKREEEIAALKNALCILDTEGVEADCSSR